MKTVAQFWQGFQADVMPPGAPELQKREMRRAFYAGFFASLMAGLEMAAESGPNDDVGATMIQRLHDECHAFAADVQAGRA
jgi:hypothetical protein